VLRYGVIICGTLEAWQSACLRNLDQSGVAKAAYVAQLPTQEDYLVQLRSLELDFCLLFGELEAGLDLCSAAKYGTWYFAHSDLSVLESSVPGFWETYFSHDVVGAMLLKITDGDSAGVILKSAYLPIRRDSLEANVQAIFSALSGFPLSVCHDIQSGASGYLADAPIPRPPMRYGAPNRLQMLTVKLFRAKDRVIHMVGREFYHEDWSVAHLAGSPSDYIGRDASARVVRVWPHAIGRYLADPWVVSHDGKRYIFCEEFDYETDRGAVVVAELPWCDEPTSAAIEEPYHLSYPQIFEHDGVMFCIPESAQARNVCLYRAIAFPHRWQRVRTLIEDFSAVDSTLVQFNGKWWLFCTSSETAERGFNSHLYVWYADDLLGQWRQHAANPVKIDVRSSRPAGPFFTHDGRLYRPSQDCSRTYGGAICLNRIDKLTETDFKETVTGVIRPPAGRYSEGIHTISCAGSVCIVDVKRHAFYPRGFIAVLKCAAKSVALRAGVSAHALDALKKRYR